MSVYPTPLVVEQRVGGVEFSDLPCLASGQNSDFTSNDMADVWSQDIAVDGSNDPATKNIPGEVPQLVNGYNWKSEIIICPRRSNNLHNTYAAFKKYSFEGVMKMTRLEPFFILFPVDYLKEVLVPETNKLLKHPMDPGEFIWWLGCWLYMGCCVQIYSRRNWRSTSEPKMSEGAPFRLNKYMSRMMFEGILLSLRYTDIKDVEYGDVFFHNRQM